MNVIEVTDLTKHYGGHTVVDGVSFSVEESEIFAILGPNGAGKTTTVESIAGLREPDSGTIRVLGLDPQHDRDRLRSLVGVQLQESQLPDRMTVGEAVSLFASFYAEPENPATLLEELGLGGARRSAYRNLSGGQKQRLSIAHAPADRACCGFPCDRVRAGRWDRDLGTRPADRRRLVGRSRAMSTIRLIIVDDHPVVRDGLRGMLAADPELEVVGEAGDGEEALALIGSLEPDVVLMDLRMPRLGGAAAIRALAQQGVRSHVLVLTTYDTDSDVVPALEAGATGYLLKDAPRDELVRAIKAAARGEAVLAPSVAARLVNQLRAPAAETLSDRELEVLALIAKGETNRGAAACLFISEATVKTHLLHIYEKLDVNDRAAAVAKGYERGLLIPRRS